MIVILAAGALNTPQILQRSGVGRHSVLEPLQIPQSINLPIGENLCDHLQYAVTWQVQDKKSLQGILSSSMFKEALKSLKNHNDFAKSTASSQNTAQNNSKDNGLKMSSNVRESVFSLLCSSQFIMLFRRSAKPDFLFKATTRFLLKTAFTQTPCPSPAERPRPTSSLCFSLCRLVLIWPN